MTVELVDQVLSFSRDGLLSLYQSCTAKWCRACCPWCWCWWAGRGVAPTPITTPRTTQPGSGKTTLPASRWHDVTWHDLTWHDTCNCSTGSWRVTTCTTWRGGSAPGTTTTRPSASHIPSTMTWGGYLTALETHQTSHKCKSFHRSRGTGIVYHEVFSESMSRKYFVLSKNIWWVVLCLGCGHWEWFLRLGVLQGRAGGLGQHSHSRAGAVIL